MECSIVVAGLQHIDIIHRLDSEYEYDRYSRQMIEDSISSSSYINLVAYNDQEAIGYVSVSNVVDEGEVVKIVVAKSYRRNGVGKALILDILSRLKDKNVKSVFLEVRASNTPAKMLYEKTGFQKINQRQKYYGDGEDADIYRLSL